ncbi:MAG: dTDP-glucose 4,6-dehydratase [Candidatus Omnitrophica bacterium]|nr:dTDP-glucose 4,6-dehydratase [Candidatus Omnitrophota bacterium]
MKLLVTGGCGFIGSNFIRYILKKHPGYKIVNLDNIKDLEKKNNYRFVKGDICDEKIVLKLSKGADAVINFAAETHVDRSIKDPASFVKTNVYGVYSILEAVRRNSIKRFVQISTDEVYGSISVGEFKEPDPLRPNSQYAASKEGADLLCRSYFVTYKMQVVITRSSNNFGPYQYPEKVIPLFVTNALENRKLPVYADGLNVRDWLYVEDNCSAIDLVLHKGLAGEVYNIGGGNELTNMALTYAILGLMRKPKSLIKFVKDRPGHDKRYGLDCGKIKKELGWAPRRGFRAALKETVEWYEENTEWWKKLKG